MTDAMTTRFDELSTTILAAVRAGATLEEATKTAGISVKTARDWAYRGRKAPGGRYGVFARELDAVRTRSMTECEAMTHEELERHLAGAIRSGSVAAMRLWVDLRGRAASGDSDRGQDPLADIIDMASRRREQP